MDRDRRSEAALKKRAARPDRAGPARSKEPQPPSRARAGRQRNWRSGLVVAALLWPRRWPPTTRPGRAGWSGTTSSHVTRPHCVRSRGCGGSGSSSGPPHQYYPLVHSAFWVQHRLWGDATLGYHLVNIVLHVLSSCLRAGDPAAAGRTGRGPLAADRVRAPPGARGVGGLDHRAQEHAVGGRSSWRRRCLPAVRPRAELAGIRRRRRRCSAWRC